MVYFISLLLCMITLKLAIWSNEHYKNGFHTALHKPQTSSSLFMNKNDGTNLINFRVLIEKKIYGLKYIFPKIEFMIFL